MRSIEKFKPVSARRYLTACLVIIAALLMFNGTQLSKEGYDLKKGFLDPPSAARPRVWWHWMNGNITKDGIAKDLLWMKKSGIGGFQNFDAALATPQIVKDRLIYMTPGWKDAFAFTARLADSLHLEMAIAGSPGWSESGGPWVEGKDGMKKYVWSEITVNGGQEYSGKLPKPPSSTGSFQNLSVSDAGAIGGSTFREPEFYGDIAVVAYKIPDTDISLSELNPKVTSSGGNINFQQLVDGDLAKTQLLPVTNDKNLPAWIQFEFDKPQVIKAFSISGGGGGQYASFLGGSADARSLMVSDNGTDFQKLISIPDAAVGNLTIDISPTTAKYFRFTFKNPPAPVDLAAFLGGDSKPPEAPKGTEIAEINMFTSTRINQLEKKAAFTPASFSESDNTPATSDAIKEQDIVDLTGKLSDDGSINWQVPQGKWKIVRFGYSLLGITNHPASPEATGLEVDKLDPVAITNYFTNYLDQYKSATGGMMGSKGGLQFMVTDSWEAGAQNWTGNMLQEFQKRRGYSMIPWMPVLTGCIVKSTEASENFLWDFRKTLGEMVEEYHYDHLTDILKQYGMKRYSESHESGRALIADGMDVKRRAEIPMSAMWTPSILSGNNTSGYESDIRESASVAHIYGKDFVAAESLTAFGIGGNAWSYCPENLKPTADLELASGLNRFVIHTSVHQPVDDKIPGLGLGPFGQWFTRHETWADEAKAWTDYLSRSSFMLQQGKYVADVVYYYGEDDNITSLFGKGLPTIPEGYSYDFINPDALINLLSVKDGKLVTPSGMSYRLLVIDKNATKMSLPVLRKIAQLVKDGATICGAKPERTPSLSDDNAEFNKLLNQVWNGKNANVIAGKTIAQVMAQMDILPDFSYVKPTPDSKLLFVHRKLQYGDIYWVNNRTDKAGKVETTFRVTGKIPQVWHPETGRMEPVSYNMAGGLTKTYLSLQPNDAVFVVFLDKAGKSSVMLPEVTEKQLKTITGEWNITFQKDRGAPASIKMADLKSWTDNQDTGVKYFSGTASYTMNFDADKNWFVKGSGIWIDLGNVKNIAEVIVNGKSAGILWKKPFRADVTALLKQGDNKLEIKVTNLWVNRLIGDQQPGVQNKISYTTMPFYQANSPLKPSGLLGPVQLLSLSEN